MLWRCNTQHILSQRHFCEGVMMHCVAEQYVLVTPDPQDSKSIISISFPECCCSSCCLLLLATKKAYHSKERNLFITYSASRRKARLAEKVICFLFTLSLGPNGICCCCIFRENWSFAFSVEITVAFSETSASNYTWCDGGESIERPSMGKFRAKGQ